MRGVLVDSSVWIEALRRRGNIEVKLAVEGLLDAYEALLCAPVRMEVLGGSRVDERRRLGLYFSVIPYRSVDGSDWEQAIALAWRLRDGGITVPWMDVLIASITIKDDLRLYTVDTHFQKIAQLAGLQLYQPGYGGSYNPE